MSGAPTVISLGGSLIVPDEVDASFLERFVSLIRDHVSRGRSFVVITGGGAPARRYQEAARAVDDMTQDQLDWIGIHATRFNARFLQTLCGDIAHPEIVATPEDVEGVDAPLVIGGGRSPGNSTDLGAVLIGASLGANDVVNLSNIHHVYDKDPKRYDDARAFHHLAWSEYRELIPDEWDPGLSTPFDPVASRHAQEQGMRVVIAGGDTDNLNRYLETGEVDGTIIE